MRRQKKDLLLFQKKDEKVRKAGLPPGTLIYTGKKNKEKISIVVIAYDEETYLEKIYSKDDDFLKKTNDNTVTWININGLHDVDLIKKIGEFYHIHTLILEDILNVNQIPKVEEDNDNDIIYLTLNEFYFDEENNLERDQISIILGKNFIISFQEEEGDYFELIRERLRSAKGRARKKRSDYLAYVLIDAIVDSYYTILDKYSGNVDEVENNIFINKNKNHLSNIHLLNKTFINLRRSIAPLKEVIFRLLKEEVILIDKESKRFLRDVQDHVNQVVLQIDVDREYLADLVQTNMANINTHMNEIIKVLTMVSGIFIPLTFIVGVYGMNFNFLPELNWKFGYPLVWIIMVFVTILMLVIYRRKKWL